MKYVLIWLVLTSKGLTSGAQEFDSRDSCLEARAYLDKTWTEALLWGRAEVSCHPKGDK